MEDTKAVNKEELEGDKLCGYSIKEYILFKLDRNLAIAGLIAIGIASILVNDISDSAGKVLSGVVSALGMYLGIRLGSK